MADNKLDGPTATVPSALLHEIFQNVVAKSPDEVALYDGERTVSFKELNDRANVFARMVKQELSSYGIPCKGSREPVMCLMMVPSIGRIVAILAMMKLGVAYLPLEASLPINRIIRMIREVEPLCLICSSENAKIINNLEIISEGLRILEFEFLPTKFEENVSSSNLLMEERLSKEANPLAIVMYTSGSTGAPKGVRLRQKNMVNRLTWQWRVFPFLEGEVGVAKTSIMFLDSFTETWGCLLKQVPVVIVQKEKVVDTETFIKILEKYKVSRLVLVPSLLKKLILMISSGITPLKMFSNVRLVISSGESLPPDLAVDFFRTIPGICSLANFYGTTEVAGDVIYHVFSSEEQVRKYTRNGCLSIGYVVDNCSIHLVDEHLKPVENPEQDGEIVVSGLNVADEYMVNNTTNFVKNTLEERKGHEMLYRTGDYGVIFNGHIYYKGRKDSVVKIRGQRVSLIEVGDAVQRMEGVDKTVVLLRQPGGQNQAIVAFVLLKTGITMESQDVMEYCLKELPKFMVPEVMIVKEFPLQPQTGKIDRQRLLDIYEEESFTDGGEIEDVDPVLDNVLGIVASVLGRPRRAVKSADNFFDIGGNSINAISVIVKLKEIGIHMDTTDFLAANCLEDVVSHVSFGVNPELTIGKLNPKYSIQVIQEGDKADVIRILSKAFLSKDAITLALGVPANIFCKHLDKMWPTAFASGMSVLIREKATGKVIATTLFADMAKCAPPDDLFTFSSYMTPIGAFMDSIEASFQHKPEGRWLIGLVGATDLDLSWQENIELFYHMEMEAIRRAAAAGYDGIESLNTHPVTVSLGTHYLGYKTIKTTQINQFQMKDGRRPFEKIPDNVVCETQLKYLK